MGRPHKREPRDSDIILLLVSSSFIASPYCYDKEMQRALEKHDAGEARVIPIILRPVDWSGAPFARLQPLPRDGKAVSRWSNRDEAWMVVAKGIRAAVKQLRGERLSDTPELVDDEQEEEEFASQQREILPSKPSYPAPDYIAPDGSEIRLLMDLSGGLGSLAQCVLPTAHVSVAQRHKTIGEIWYFVQGLGQVWRKSAGEEQTEETVNVSPGSCLAIEPGEHFQFRNTGAEPLTLMIATIPSWSGPDEAELVKGRWQTNI